MRFFLWPMGVAVAACSSAPPPLQTWTDTVGTSYDWSCPSSECDITSAAAMPTACNEWTMMVERVIVMCPTFGALAENTTSPEAGLCRPLACVSDADCPISPDWSAVCQKNMCQVIGWPLFYEDVVALCLAHVPRSMGCQGSPPPDSVTQAALAEASTACSNGCTVPVDCLQP